MAAGRALGAALAVANSLLLIAVVLGLFAVSMPCFGIAALSYQLEVTPDHLLGRVGTAFNLLIWAATPIGAAVAGGLLDVFSPRWTGWVFAAWVLVLSLITSIGGNLGQIGRGGDAVPPSSRPIPATNRCRPSHEQNGQIISNYASWY